MLGSIGKGDKGMCLEVEKGSCASVSMFVCYVFPTFCGDKCERERERVQI